jgi:hypothetical protein
MSNRPLTGVGEGDGAADGLPDGDAAVALDAGGVTGDPPQAATRTAIASRRFTTLPPGFGLMADANRVDPPP